MHYLPERPIGEDDSTIKRHIHSLMQVENGKLKQDITKIRMLMDLTFADRRDGIVNKLWKVEQLNSTYPPLLAVQGPQNIVDLAFILGLPFLVYSASKYIFKDWKLSL